MAEGGHLDVQLEELSADAVQGITLKTGVCVRQLEGPSGCWGCCTIDTLLGRVPASQRAQVAATAAGAACKVRIRSIQRDKETKTVTGIQIRVCSTAQRSWPATLEAATRPDNPVLVSPELEDLRKTGRVLTRPQLEGLAADDLVRKDLAIPELQAALAAVDGAPCREAALAKAMEDPTFARFCDHVLDVVASSGGP